MKFETYYSQQTWERRDVPVGHRRRWTTIEEHELPFGTYSSQLGLYVNDGVAEFRVRGMDDREYRTTLGRNGDRAELNVPFDARRPGNVVKLEARAISGEPTVTVFAADIGGGREANIIDSLAALAEEAA